MTHDEALASLEFAQRAATALIVKHDATVRDLQAQRDEARAALAKACDLLAECQRQR